MDIAVVLAGFIVGGLIGLTSAGSGVLLAPILMTFGIPPRIIVGSSLLYSFATKVVGTIQHQRQRTINLKWVWILACGSLPGALVGVSLLHWIGAHFGIAALDLFIKKALGIVLVISAALLIGREVFSSKLYEKGSERRFVDPDTHKWLVIGLSALIGLIVGVTSIGSGSLIALFLLGFSALEGKEIVGTNIAHSVLVSLVAAIGHGSMGNIDYRLVGQLLAGSLPGIIIGSHLTTVLPAKSLRLGTAAFILLSGLRIATQ